MKEKVLILAGGYSKERQISFKTGMEVYKSLKKKYNVKLLDPSGDLINQLRKIKPDVVFNALHGTYGEDGYIQTILESEKIKYTHSGVLSSSLAIDKDVSKKIFKENKILTPPSFRLNNTNKISKKNITKKIISSFKFPVVIKPLNEGSSVGVYICNNKNITKNLFKLKDYDEILVEKYIPGREIQSAIFGKKKLGAIELVPSRKFYDFKAKYHKNAKTKHLMPAPLTESNYTKVNDIALKAHKLLRCRGVTRSDFRFYKNKFYLLELNTQPGMTSMSLVPEIARFQKINFFTLLDMLIKDASYNK